MARVVKSPVSQLRFTSTVNWIRRDPQRARRRSSLIFDLFLARPWPHKPDLIVGFEADESESRSRGVGPRATHNSRRFVCECELKHRLAMSSQAGQASKQAAARAKLALIFSHLFARCAASLLAVKLWADPIMRSLNSSAQRFARG